VDSKAGESGTDDKRLIADVYNPDYDNSSLPAYPMQLRQMEGGISGGVLQFHGLSKRELIAAMALQGLCAAIDNYAPNSILHPKGFAVDALDMADALLAELESTSAKGVERE
jgi:hypothetical protein